MLKKLLPRTPLGIALTTAAVLLAVSPEARRFTRKMAVKGVGAIMGMAEGIKGLSSGVTGQVSHLIAESRTGSNLQRDSSLPYDADIQSDLNINEDIPFNVMSDEAIKGKLQLDLE